MQINSLFAWCLLARISAQYCGGGPTSALDSNLGAVTLKGDSETIANTNDCPGQIGVQDLTNLKADLKAGENYTLSYAVTTCGGTYARVSAAWIDFNLNEIYEENEMVAPAAVTSGQASQTVSVTFTVPATAQTGLTRMRVVVSERATPVVAACDPFGYGGVKEFGITLKNGPPPPPPPPPVPVTHGIIVLYTDLACQRGAVKMEGTNATWGTQVSPWSLQEVSVRDISGSGALATESTVIADDLFALFLNEEIAEARLGVARPATHANYSFFWQMHIPKITFGLCSSWATISNDIQIANSAGENFLSFLAVSLS